MFLTETAVAWPTALRSADSSVRFSLRLLLWQQVEGSFHAVRGALRQRDGVAWICAEVRVDSARMVSPARRQELLGADFFAAERHPLVRFRSAGVPVALLNAGGELPGRLMLRGITRPVVFQLQPMVCKDQDPGDCSVQLAGKVRRSVYGMRSKPAVLGDWVRLELTLHTCGGRGQAGCRPLPGCTHPAPALRP